MRRTLVALTAATSLLIGLAACGNDSGSEETAAGGTIKVGVSPVPHAEILKYVSDNLAAAEGLKIEIVEFNDYIQPNTALQDRQLDANYFQHIPYLEEEIAPRATRSRRSSPCTSSRSASTPRP